MEAPTKVALALVEVEVDGRRGALPADPVDVHVHERECQRGFTQVVG